MIDLFSKYIAQMSAKTALQCQQQKYNTFFSFATICTCFYIKK